MNVSKHLLLGAGPLALSVSLAASPAFAQSSPDDADSASEGNTIVVTGSRLNVNPNLEGASPVISVTDEQIKAQGTVRIEDLVNQLPQVFAGQAGEVSNSATGTSTLNLRGLGAERTLVLIDGRRLPYGSSQTSPVNLDIIPTQLIDRVEILTGGASAVYGSDAVGGVANFVLKRDFEGVELDFQGGFQQNGNSNSFYESVLSAGNQPIPGSVIDGEEYSITGILGTNTADGRGNVTIFANYEKRNQVTQDNRVYSACTLGPSGSATSFGGAGCVGSGNFRLMGGEVGIIDPAGSPTNSSDTDETVSLFFQEQDGNLVEYVGGPAQTYNFGQRNFFQRPSERFTIYAKGYYDLTDNLEFFADLAYVSNVSDAQIAETASFGVGAYSVNCDNPYLEGVSGSARGQTFTYYDIYGCSADDIANGTIVDGVTVSHRNVEGGPRNSRLENSTFRIVSGLRGSFGEDVWSYEVFGQYAQTSDTSISSNDFVIANLDQALLAVRDDDGNVVCLDPSGGCVPYNPFQRGPNGESLITSEQTDFIHGVGIVTGETTQLIVGANVQADLGEYGLSSPFSEDGLGLLLGSEFRKDTLEAIPDEISQVPGGGFTGVGGATLPVAGSIEVFELFGELQIPIVTDRPWFKELTLSGQYRYSDYTADGNGVSRAFSTDAFGIQAVWAVVDDLKFRAQFQRSVRAPNVIELFTGQDTGLPNLDSNTDSDGNQIYDPCATSNPIASFEACANTGVTADQYGSIIDVISGQTQSLTGGNTDLVPESSDTFTAGVVLEPSFIPGLTVSVDYFDITVEDFITEGIEAQTTLDQCLATGDAAFCDLITRSASGSLVAGIPGVGFLANNLNIAELNTSGFDIQVLYTNYVDGLGEFRFDYAATILNKNDFVPFPGGDATIDCAGFLNNGCIQPVNPAYRHRTTLTWDTLFGPDLSLTWRHFSATDNEVEADNPEIDDQLPAQNYVDVSFTYPLNEVITLRGGMLNALNNQPPISSSSGPPLGNGNTFPTIYDTGRTVFGGVNFKF